MKTFSEYISEAFGPTSPRQKARNRKEAGLDNKIAFEVKVDGKNIISIKKTSDGGNGIKSNYDTIKINSDMPYSVSPVKYTLYGMGDIHTREDIEGDLLNHYKIQIDNKWIITKDKKTAEKLVKKLG